MIVSKLTFCRSSELAQWPQHGLPTSSPAVPLHFDGHQTFFLSHIASGLAGARNPNRDAKGEVPNACAHTYSPADGGGHTS